MLKERVITAVILVAFFLAGLLLLSPFAFSVAIAVIVTYAAWEWSDLAGLEASSRWLYVLAIAAALFLVAHLMALLPSAYVVNVTVAKTLLASGCLWWLIALSLVRSYPDSVSLWSSKFVRSLMGFFVLVPTWVAVTTLIHQPDGVRLVLLVILIVVLADVGAYFVGRKFGKTKLAPRLSPAKSWEGFFGGLGANVVLILLLGVSLGLSASAWGWLALVVLLTSMISVLGDLLESMLKRFRGIKDSGNILPGHGGVMDRVDSLSAALPVFTLVYLLSNLSF